MNLTRHNYEEYFLRYVDGELAADERQEVEAFLEEHPDLFEEMDSLQMTVLPQDEVFAFDKSLLYQYTTEERPARIIPLTRRRLSVAAAVAIALGTSAALWIARDRGFLHTGGPSIAQVRPVGPAANGSANGSSAAGSANGSANGASTGSPAEGTAPVSPDATTGGSAPVGATPNGSTPNGSTPDDAATTATTTGSTTATTAGSTTATTATIAGSTTATTATGATTGSATGATTATHDPATTAIATTTGTTATTGTTNSAITAATTGTATTASATSTTTGAAGAATAALQTASSGEPTTHALASKENNPTRPVTTATPVSYHTLEDGDQAADEDKILFVRADQVVNGEVKGFFRRAGRLLKRSTSINNDIVRADSDR